MNSDSNGADAAGIVAREWHLGADGYEVATRSASYSPAFAVPPPTAARVRLLVIPDAFHSVVHIDFGSGKRADFPPLRVGRTDVGDLQPNESGVISGSVTGPAGARVADALCSVGSSNVDSFGPSERTAADGTYRIEHARIGRVRVLASKAGLAMQFREDVEVAAGRVTEGVDFVLTENPFSGGPVH
jgi:hypothetical protein